MSGSGDGLTSGSPPDILSLRREEPHELLRLLPLLPLLPLLLLLLMLPWADLALPESLRAPTGKHLFMLSALARAPIRRSVSYSTSSFGGERGEGREPPHAYANCSQCTVLIADETNSSRAGPLLCSVVFISHVVVCVCACVLCWVVLWCVCVCVCVRVCCVVCVCVCVCVCVYVLFVLCCVVCVFTFSCRSHTLCKFKLDQRCHEISSSRIQSYWVCCVQLVLAAR